MRELNIAYGNNRQAKRWVNKAIRFDDLKERLRVPIRTCLLYTSPSPRDA